MAFLLKNNDKYLIGGGVSPATWHTVWEGERVWTTLDKQPGDSAGDPIPLAAPARHSGIPGESYIRLTFNWEVAEPYADVVSSFGYEASFSGPGDGIRSGTITKYLWEHGAYDFWDDIRAITSTSRATRLDILCSIGNTEITASLDDTFALSEAGPMTITVTKVEQFY